MSGAPRASAGPSSSLSQTIQWSDGSTTHSKRGDSVVTLFLPSPRWRSKHPSLRKVPSPSPCGLSLRPTAVGGSDSLIVHRSQPNLSSSRSSGP
jgi:hypothetical protein